MPGQHGDGAWWATRLPRSRTWGWVLMAAVVGACQLYTLETSYSNVEMRVAHAARAKLRRAAAGGGGAGDRHTSSNRIARASAGQSGARQNRLIREEIPSVSKAGWIFARGRSAAAAVSQRSSSSSSQQQHGRSKASAGVLSARRTPVLQRKGATSGERGRGRAGSGAGSAARGPGEVREQPRETSTAQSSSLANLGWWRRTTTGGGLWGHQRSQPGSISPDLEKARVPAAVTGSGQVRQKSTTTGSSEDTRSNGEPRNGTATASAAVTVKVAAASSHEIDHIFIGELNSNVSVDLSSAGIVSLAGGETTGRVSSRADFAGNYSATLKAVVEGERENPLRVQKSGSSSLLTRLAAVLGVGGVKGARGGGRGGGGGGGVWGGGEGNVTLTASARVCAQRWEMDAQGNLPGITHEIYRRHIAEVAKHLPVFLDGRGRDALLGQSQSPGYNWTRCALIGNGGNLRLRQFGPIIDRHSLVARCNQAPVETWEKRVGRKTTLRVLNNKWLLRYGGGSDLDLPLEHRVTLVVTRGLRGGRRRLYARVASAHMRARGVRAMTMHWRLRRIASSMLQDYHRELRCSPIPPPVLKGAVPTSGMLAAVLLMSACERLSVYGFGGGKGTHAPYQYFSKNAREYHKHSFNLEHALIAALGYDGYLTLCDETKPNNCSS